MTMVVNRLKLNCCSM